jgi:TolB-like protein
MKRTLLAAALTLLGAFVFSQEQIAIAVFPFEDMDNLFTRNESIIFYRQFSSEFTNKNNGRFKVIPRQDVDRLIDRETKFQLSNYSLKARTAEMELVLNDTRILSGFIRRTGNRIIISVSLFTFPGLERLPVGVDLRVANKDELFDNIPELVQSMMSAIARGGANTENRPAPARQIYNIGDTGPAGGIVFFDRGITRDGWRYLEAAPAEGEFTARWGAYGTDVANTMTGIGFGKRNTQIIVERLNALGETSRAAQICASLDINGYKDWFLPSKDELDLMYKNLKQKELGGFGNNWYWSSSQYGSSVAWSQRFSDGDQYNYFKSSTDSVRAIRAFW